MAAKLTQGAVSAALLGLTLPMILTIFANAGVGVFEIWLLGGIGTDALAAYSFTFPISSALFSIALGLAIGLSSVMARTVGSGDLEKVRRLATDGIILLFIVLSAAAMLGYLLIEPLFSLIGATPETMPLIRAYMQLWFLSLPLFAAPMAGSNALRANGDARLASLVMVSTSFTQALFDAIFIFGWFGVPIMGIEGLGWALLVSRLLAFILTLLALFYKARLLDLTLPSLSAMLLSWRQILAVGLPATATNLIGPISAAIIIGMLAQYGKEAVAGFGIATRIEALSIIPLFALSASIGPFVGQNWGAEFYRRARKGMQLAFTWSMVWGLLVAIVFFVFSDPIGGLFDDDPKVISYTSLYLAIVPVSFGAWGVLMVASATFNSLGKPIRSTLLSLVRMLVVYVPAAYIGQAMLGVTGIFIAGALSNLLMGAVAYIWNRRTYRVRAAPAPV